MIPAAKNPYVEGWFRGYVRRYLEKSFHRVMLAGELPPSVEGPVLVCMSHSSWWDMLLAFWASADVLGWDGYGPMDERQLERYSILSRIGVFGVDRQSLQGSREFLEYARGLLDGKPRALWITAQGAMVATSVRPVRFYSGVAHLAQSLGSCHVVVAALDYEFWDDKRPEAFLSFGPMRRVEAGVGFSRRGLLQELEGELEHVLDRLTELRLQRDPEHFRILLQSGGGISPVYDGLRRLGARLQGRPFAPEHSAMATPPRWGPGRRD